MFFILFIVIGLVAWALHLMQEAIQQKEFSLMLAGFLVSAAATGLMTVYFLMGHYVGYMTQMAERSYSYNHSYDRSHSQPYESTNWNDPTQIWSQEWIVTASNRAS